MTELIARREDPPAPLAMPVLLSFVAGYLDSYTYLSLFGLFAAQVTGSFVIAGAEFVTSDFGIAGKLLAIAAFLAAAVATTALILSAGEARRAALPWMLALEALLLAVFAAIVVFGPAVRDARDWHGIVAGIFAAMAMGVQSVGVRLLMKDVPQTNVMTGNVTQLSIAVTELLMTRRRFAENPRGGRSARPACHRTVDRRRISRRRRQRRGRLRHDGSKWRAGRSRHRRRNGAVGAGAPTERLSFPLNWTLASLSGWLF
jgi:uncharacterized membrane protein YoaK (UPF0700 family)